MLFRVDTTCITRGLEFNVAIHINEEPTVSLYAFDAARRELMTLEAEIKKVGVFYKAFSKAPSFDGYLLAKINDKSILVKKIGYPSNLFVIAYKENYTIPYKIYLEDGTIAHSGNLLHIIDGFYYCEINYDISIIETLKKRFILNSNIGKLNYDVSMTDTTLEDVTLGDYELNSNLGDVTLSDINLDSVNINAALPTVTIKEY